MDESPSDSNPVSICIIRGGPVPGWIFVWETFYSACVSTKRGPLSIHLTILLPNMCLYSYCISILSQYRVNAYHEFSPDDGVYQKGETVGLTPLRGPGSMIIVP